MTLDIDDFLTLPLDDLVRACGYDPDRVLVGDRRSRIADAVDESIETYRVLIKRRARGLANEAARVVNDPRAADRHFAQSPDESMGRSRQLSVFSKSNANQRVWIYEHDVPEPFEIEDEIAQLRPKLMSSIRDIVTR